MKIKISKQLNITLMPVEQDLYNMILEDQVLKITFVSESVTVQILKA